MLANPPHGMRVLAVGGCLAAAAFLGAISTGDNDLGAFALPAARLVAAGHPLAVYTLTSDGIPTDNGPLALLGLGALVRLVGAANTPGLRAVVAVVAALFALLAANEAWRAIVTWRPHGWLWRDRLLIMGLVAANPVLWRGIAHYGHYELAPLIWLGLLAARMMREERIGLAAIISGLALLTRGTALLGFLPLILVLVWARHWRAAGRLLGGAGSIALLGVAPFLLAYPGATIDALVGYRARLPVGAGSLWVMTIDTPLEASVPRIAPLLILLVGVGWCIWALRAQRSPGTAALSPVNTPHLYLLLGLMALAFPALSPMVWPYYYAECIAPLIVWRAALRGTSISEIVFPAAAITGMMLIAEIALLFPPFLPIGYLIGIVQSMAALGLVRMFVLQ